MFSSPEGEAVLLKCLVAAKVPPVILSNAVLHCFLVTGRSQSHYFFELPGEMALVRKAGRDSDLCGRITSRQELAGFFYTQLLLIEVRWQSDKFFKGTQ